MSDTGLELENISNTFAKKTFPGLAEVFGSEESRQLPDRSLTDRKADISAQSSAPAGPCRYRGSHTLDQQLIFSLWEALASPKTDPGPAN